MPQRVPRLLPVDDEVITITDGSRAQRRQVRAGVGFGETLAPGLVAPGHRTQVARLLLVGAPLHDRRPDVGQADDVEWSRCIGSGHLLGENDLFVSACAATPVLD